jgi:hypothetical protein
MTDQTGAPPATDIQDPLPEANWLWRRVLSYGLCLAVLAMMVGFGWAMFKIVNSVTGKIDNMNAAAVVEITLASLRTVEAMFRLMFWALMVVVTYYMVAPSAEQIVKMLQTAGLLKAGVQMASRTVETPERRETVSTVAQPPQPVVPPASEAPTETLPDEMPSISAPDGGRGSERLL